MSSDPLLAKGRKTEDNHVSLDFENDIRTNESKKSKSKRSKSREMPSDVTAPNTPESGSGAKQKYEQQFYETDEHTEKAAREFVRNGYSGACEDCGAGGANIVGVFCGACDEDRTEGDSGASGESGECHYSGACGENGECDHSDATDESQRVKKRVLLLTQGGETDRMNMLSNTMKNNPAKDDGLLTENECEMTTDINCINYVNDG